MKWIAPICALLLSCGGEQATPNSPESAVQPASAVDPTTGLEAPESAPAKPAPEGVTEEVPEGGDCVTECVQSRQMQATSIEQITRDCEKSCSAATE